MNELKVNFDNLTEEERADLLKLVEKANKTARTVLFMIGTKLNVLGEKSALRA